MKAVRAELHARDAEREDDLPTTVTVVGHSLGGALATLCATDLVMEENITSVRLYTFGCPRVGNEAFAKALQNTTLVHTRVTHDRDVVPTLPFRHLGFHHTAREVWQRTLRIGKGSMSLSVEIICDGSGRICSVKTPCAACRESARKSPTTSNTSVSVLGGCRQGVLIHELTSYIIAFVVNHRRTFIARVSCSLDLHIFRLASMASSAAAWSSSGSSAISWSFSSIGMRAPLIPAPSITLFTPSTPSSEM